MQSENGSSSNGSAGFRQGYAALRLNGGPDPRDAKSTKWVRSFQAGDRTAFDKLFVKWRESVCAYATAALRDRDQAEDVAQEVFARVFVGLDKFDPGSSSDSFRKWLFTIAKNEVARAQHAAERAVAAPLGETAAPADPAAEESSVEGVGAEPARPIHRLREELALVSDEREFNATEARITQVLGWISDTDLAWLVESLPEPQRKALTLRFTQDLGAEEVARAMGCGTATVWQLQSRALRYLRDRLERVGERRMRARRRSAMLRRIGPLPVLGARRFALTTRARLPGSSRSPGMNRYSGFAQSARW